MLLQAGDPVAVRLFAQPVRMKWRKSPVLSLGEDRIGRRASRGLEHEGFPFSPYVVTAAVDTQRKIDVPVHLPPAGPVGQRLQLLIGLPLHVTVVSPNLLVDVGTAACCT